MITKEEALKKAKSYLDKAKIEYSSINENSENIGFVSADDERYLPQSYGKYKGKRINFYSVGFSQIWGIEERGLGLYINADTGELLYIITPHGYWDIEE